MKSCFLWDGNNIPINSIPPHPPTPPPSLPFHKTQFKIDVDRIDSSFYVIRTGLKISLNLTNIFKTGIACTLFTNWISHTYSYLNATLIVLYYNKRSPNMFITLWHSVVHFNPCATHKTKHILYIVSIHRGSHRIY